MKQKLCELFTGFVMSLAVWNFAMAEPIEIATPLVPGGAVDLTARAISKALTEAGIESVVTYRPGGNGDIARQHVLQKQDNVILVASSATFVFTNVTANRENVYTQQMTLVGPTLTNAMVFLTKNKYSSIGDLVADAKTQPTTCGVSNAHGEIELQRMNKNYGTKFVPVLYKGTGQLIPDLLGGHVTCGYDQIAPYTGLTDKLLFLATSEPWKNTIPAVSAALPGYTYHTWYASAVPNNSNLLKNKRLMTILANWTQRQDLVQPLLDRSFQLTQPNADLNSQAQHETQKYIKLLKQ